ncbi:MAG TPA: hypothetical protein ENO22_12175 [candidate division Zixibacteria bacterium]|nr:hypothetical protein [candidate division Zixibacteria bacterium]HER00087.1 hypothetical protein [candidate division Zixibacteria bacterium]
MKHINLILIVFIFIIAVLAVQQVRAEDKTVIYKVVISEEVMTDAHAVAAWREYAQAKKKWREELFFQTFPDEKKYRYSYREELDCRKRLAEYWIDLKEGNPGISNSYLDQLAQIYNSLYFPEYVYKYFRSGSWEVRKNRFRLDEFKEWAKENLDGHDPKTYSHLDKIEF